MRGRGVACQLIVGIAFRGVHNSIRCLVADGLRDVGLPGRRRRLGHRGAHDAVRALVCCRLRDAGTLRRVRRGVRQGVRLINDRIYSRIGTGLFQVQLRGTDTGCPYGLRFDAFRRLVGRSLRDVRLPGCRGCLGHCGVHNGVCRLVTGCLLQEESVGAAGALTDRFRYDLVRRLVLCGFRDLAVFGVGRPFHFLCDPVRLDRDRGRVPVHLVNNDRLFFDQQCDLLVAFFDQCPVLDGHAGVRRLDPCRAVPCINHRAGQFVPCQRRQFVPGVVRQRIPCTVSGRLGPCVAGAQAYPAVQARVRQLHIAGCLLVHAGNCRGDLFRLNIQPGPEGRHIVAQRVHHRRVRLQRHRVGCLRDFRLELTDHQVVEQQFPLGPGPYIHPVLPGHLFPCEAGQFLPGVLAHVVPGLVVDRLHPNITGNNAGRRRLCFRIEDRSVAQLRDPAVNARDRLRDRALALPVADGALDISVAADILNHQLIDESLTGPEFIHVDLCRRNGVDQRVACVDIGRVQFAGRDG